MRFDILTIFPEMFKSPLEYSILKRAVDSGKVQVFLHDIRDYASGPHAKVDDTPYGGGAGMVFKPEPVVKTIEAVPSAEKRKNILMTPRGGLLTQKKVMELAQYNQLVIVCGRYEGVDERVVTTAIDEEICIGDYVLTGGEWPALVLMDAVSRLIPGVLTNENSLENESFSKGLLEHPHYTRPPVFMGQEVPSVLRSGHHKEIEIWRRQTALKETWEKRPELLAKASLTSEEKRYLKGLQKRKKSG